MTALLDRARVEIKLGDYGVAQATALADSSLLSRVQEYRRQAGSRMVPLDAEEITQRVPKADYFVSRKVDGEFTVLVYRDGECFSLNPGGTVRIGLPWEEEAGKLLGKAGIKNALIAGELYVQNEERRPRVHDVTTVARQPQNKTDLSRLQFAAFDVISIDDQNNARPFGDTWKLIEKWFGSGQRVHPVESKTVTGAHDVQQLFDQWVLGEGAEGIVVRSDTAGLFKIKPRHNLDAVIIGFTESVGDRQGMLHDLLLAVMRHDGTLQVLTRVGGGFNEDQRRSMLSDLKDMVVESQYAEVNSDHVAYQMVRPDCVVEISCLDMISQTTRGGPINRMVLNFAGHNGSLHYETVRRLPLVSVISPQFIRERSDKTAHRQDVRIEQVSQRVEVLQVDRDARQMAKPKSQLLQRDVYTKSAKGETMVRKFVIWKTNKEQESEEYPAYVLHFTDFSPNRAAPLDRDVRVSSSLEQIQALRAEMIAENIKKGWDLHSSQVFELAVSEQAAPASTLVAPATVAPEAALPATPEPVAATEPTAPAPKKSAKKKAAKEPGITPKLASSEGTRKKAAKKKSG